MDVTGAAAGGSGPLSAVVSEYYRNIDHRNVEAALSCFAPDAVYRRPGYDAFVGFQAISTFYHGVRVISRGRHDLESIVEDADTVAVRGSCRGTSHAGDPFAVRFADFWRFSGLLVVERNTYFDAAAV
ncbi:nuclear transport factor 2 family protein [Micromonospora sp. WMMA1363]|uniref:nuclear transport factor 2 family protein n=1 Tax=Micromonospora sp. WMMA1363 TaxID=3053985 RepID=UPI00259C83B8|nr:nuclear transport factor 2 family protein [Micromonospora sp. WMMA1363]MDM4719716.1 nuclear transport factor 2 family protein [Micromonospora sp. WMMA1363]